MAPASDKDSKEIEVVNIKHLQPNNLEESRAITGKISKLLSRLDSLPFIVLIGE